MNNKGFTLVELLLCLAMFGIILVIGLCASRDMLKTSLVSLRPVGDDEVFRAATSYVNENKDVFNGKLYTCVTVKDLVDFGYLDDTNDYELKTKIVKLKRNNVTKRIYNVEYVNDCD